MKCKPKPGGKDKDAQHCIAICITKDGCKTKCKKWSNDGFDDKKQCIAVCKEPAPKPKKKEPVCDDLIDEGYYKDIDYDLVMVEEESNKSGRMGQQQQQNNNKRMLRYEKECRNKCKPQEVKKIRQQCESTCIASVECKNKCKKKSSMEKLKQCTAECILNTRNKNNKNKPTMKPTKNRIKALSKSKSAEPDTCKPPLEPRKLLSCVCVLLNTALCR